LTGKTGEGRRPVANERKKKHRGSEVCQLQGSGEEKAVERLSGGGKTREEKQKRKIRNVAAVEGGEG